MKRKKTENLVSYTQLYRYLSDLSLNFPFFVRIHIRKIRLSNILKITFPESEEIEKKTDRYKEEVKKRRREREEIRRIRRTFSARAGKRGRQTVAGGFPTWNACTSPRSNGFPSPFPPHSFPTLPPLLRRALLSPLLRTRLPTTRPIPAAGPANPFAPRLPLHRSPRRVPMNQGVATAVARKRENSKHSPAAQCDSR